MIDGTKSLGLKTFADELAFSRHCAAHGVFVGIGQSYHAHEPGWLRVTFSVDRQVLETALGRLDRALADTQ
jgi:bifunctional pyridoxal-dependent enzyme with beta-cystathionase and maltose regulon repressor activities